MKKAFPAFLVVIALATILAAGPSIFSVYQGGTGLNAVAAHQVFVGTASNVFTAKTIPDCQDTSGNHLNYTQSSDSFSCGTSSSGGGGGGSSNNPFNTPVAASSTIPYGGLHLWLSADCVTLSDASTCSTPSNGATVSDWQDRSGNFFHGGDGTHTLTFNTSQINGLPAMTFSSSYQAYPTSVPVRDGITIFAVLKSTSGSTTKGGIFSASNVTQHDGFYWYTHSSSGKEQGVDQAGTAALGTGTAASDSNWHQLNLTCTIGGNPSFRIDRTADTTISGASCTTVLTGSFGTGANILSIGYNTGISGEFFAGQMAEILVYKRVLSSTEITNVESYLHTRYGL